MANVPKLEFTPESQNLVISKVLAIEAVYKKWGEILSQVIKSQLPSDTGKLRGAIGYKIVAPKNKKDISQIVKLSVGLVNSNYWKYRNLIRFFERGTRRHFIPIKAKAGYYTGILGYMKRHGLVYLGDKTIGNNRSTNSRVTWRWKSNQRIFYGIMGQTFARWIFLTTFRKYDNQIKSEINAIINRKR